MVALEYTREALRLIVGVPVQIQNVDIDMLVSLPANIHDRERPEKTIIKGDIECWCTPNFGHQPFVSEFAPDSHGYEGGWFQVSFNGVTYYFKCKQHWGPTPYWMENPLWTSPIEETRRF
jgi:hypothetical protein